MFAISPTIKDQLEKLAKGEVVAIIQNKFKGASGASCFEVYGADAGLHLTQNVRELNSDIRGAFDLILKSNEKSLEPHMPKSLYLTDYATTKAIVDAILD